MDRILRTLITGAAFAALSIPFALAATPATTRLSQSAAGVEGNQDSSLPAISADGRFVAFASKASNLVPLDVNAKEDVFTVDRKEKTISRVSVSSSGLESNGVSTAPSISADGRFVAFESTATNLVPGKGQGVYVRDRQTNQTAFLGPGNTPVICADGTHIAFVSSAVLLPADTNLFDDVYLADRVTGALELISVAGDGTPGDGNSGRGGIALTPDGGIIAFQSLALNLVPSSTNAGGDVFIRDRIAGATERVSLTFDGSQAEKGCSAPAISADGNLIAFETTSTNMVPGDANDSYDVFVRNRAASTTTRVSLKAAGGEIGFDSRDPHISPDGRYISFETEDDTVVSGDNNGRLDIFVRDLTDAVTFRVSVTDAGASPNGASYHTALGSDMRYVAFTSEGTNLLTGVSTINKNVYVRGPLIDTPGVLAFATQPGGAAANTVFATQPVVEARNLDGGVIWDFDEPVELALKPDTGRAGAVLSGSTSATAVNGTAVFTDLKIDLAGTGYILSASSASLPSVESLPFDVAQVATHLTFTTHPGGAAAGAFFTTQPVVEVRDAEANVVAGYNGSVAIAIKTGTGRTGAVLAGTSTVAVANGVASFAGLSIDLAGTGYVLTASSGTLTSADSAPFDVSQVATHLVFNVQPGGARAGSAFPVQPVIQALDVENNVALNFTGPVSIAIKAGTGQTGAILSGALTVNASAGVAAFTNLSIDRPAAGYVLVAVSPPLTQAESAPFTVARIPFTAADIATALRWTAGLSAPIAAEVPTFDVVQAGESNGRIDLLDAQSIARKVGGLADNP